MPKLYICVGCPCSGKSFFSEKFVQSHKVTRISQDDQGRDGHMKEFLRAVTAGEDIIVDRMNFNKQQRAKYMDLVGKNYDVVGLLFITGDVVYDKALCESRAATRETHPTIKTVNVAAKVIKFFFDNYEPMQWREGFDEISYDPFHTYFGDSGVH